VVAALRLVRGVAADPGSPVSLRGEVSLVLETSNVRPWHRIGIPDVVRAWRRQTRADCIREWIVVSAAGAPPGNRELFDGLPVRRLELSDAAYYRQKNAGFAAATCPLVVLADSDVLPAPDWLERAIAALERADARVALVTGRSRYLPGPFAREMALAQMPNHSSDGGDVTHFLAHNVLLRAALVRPLGPFREEAIRLGPDTDLAERLIAGGYRLLYDPHLAATHDSHRRLTGLYRSSVLTGYAFGLFERSAGRPGRGPLRSFAGRVRVLALRLRRGRRDLGIPVRRLPLSLVFCVAYAAAFERGRALALAGRPKP
jgi:hypothetical protein